MAEDKGSLAAAMALFQASLTPLKPEHSADIPTKKGGRIQYKYAELADVINHVRPGLAENGLSFTQSCIYLEGRLMVQMRIMHISGEEEIGYFPVDASGDMRALGSAVTYAKRYLAVAMFGVAISGEDDDAQRATDPKRQRGGDGNRWAQDEKKVREFTRQIRACGTADDLRDWWTDNSDAVAELNPDQVATIKTLVSQTNAKLEAVEDKRPPAKAEPREEKPKAKGEPAPAPPPPEEKPKSKPKEQPKPEPKPAPAPQEDAPPPPPDDDDDFDGAFD